MRSSALRHLSAGIAALWLAAPAASVVHGALSSHAHHFCPEHQAFEEAHGQGAPDASAPAEEGRFAALRADVGGAHAGHASCPLANLAHLAQKLRLEAGSGGVLAAAEPEGRPMPLGFALTPSTPPLSVAPKTSPPLS